MQSIKTFSTFTGIGGFEIGIERACKSLKIENQIVGFSEIDKYAIAVYQKHFPNHKNYGDIKQINENTLPDFDLFVGGFPCQSFSIAGLRKGFDDTRGTLFFDIARILKAKRPRLLLLENVKGLLSHDDGNTFKTIIATLAELGYDVQWQVLNSKDFGVPQNRERVLIAGHLRGTPRPEIFPITESSDRHLEEITQGVSDAQRIYQTSGIAKTLKGLGGGQGAKTGLYAIQQRARGNNKGGTHKIAPTLTGRSYEHNNHLVSKTIRTGGRGSPHGSKQNWDSYEIAGKIRRLTPKECERLQGYPDNWTKEGVDYNYGSDGEISGGAIIPMSDTQRYKMAGNAVTTNVVQEVVYRLLGGSN